jgi:membrane-bound lytic murein transglycosylase D
MQLLKNILILFALLQLAIFKGMAAEDSSKVSTNYAPFFIQDDPVLAMLDSLAEAHFLDYIKKKNLSNKKNKFGFTPDSVPVYDDLVYESRMATLNAKTPFALDYNDAVKAYIDVYAKRKREQVSKMLSLAEFYFPLFEEKLAKYDLPLELKYLAIVESALNAEAKSRSGAMGLWQFMYGTGKMFDLQVNSYVDERSDPIKSTEAACQYLKYLYSMFGDWHLALAAYNAGPGTLSKAIRRSGGKRDFWELRPFLPAETRSYVPAFIAVNYVMSHTEEHNLYPSLNIKHYFQTDTVHVLKPLKFEQISSVIGVSNEELQFLNPVYKRNYIPCIEGKYNVLRLPSNLIAAFVNNEKSIYGNEVISEKPTNASISINVTETKKVHTVKSGEHLSLIARKYDCSVNDIRTWNNLKSNNVQPGQKLVIRANAPVTQTPVQKTVSTIPKETNNSGDKYVYYVVQPGDTLWKIANKHEGVSVEDIKKLNNIQDINQIKPGTKIKVALAG